MKTETESSGTSTTDQNEEESSSNDNLMEVVDTKVRADTKEDAGAIEKSDDDMKCDNVVGGDSNQNDIVKGNKENIMPA